MTIRRRLARSNLVMILIPVAIAAVLLLLDLMLPFQSGYHWCAELRKISNVPVMFLSSAA